MFLTSFSSMAFENSPKMEDLTKMVMSLTQLTEGIYHSNSEREKIFSQREHMLASREEDFREKINRLEDEKKMFELEKRIFESAKNEFEFKKRKLDVTEESPPVKKNTDSWIGWLCQGVSYL